MELLKEAIFTEEEHDTIVELFHTMVVRKKDIAKEVSLRIVEWTNNDPVIKHLKSLPNTEQMVDKLINQYKDEYHKKMMHKASVAEGILVKMRLYRSCVVNSVK